MLNNHVSKSLVAFSLFFALALGAFFIPNPVAPTAKWIGVYELTCRNAAGKVMWTDRIHNNLTDEGEQDLLDVYMRNAAAPATFYIRLYDDTPTETSTLAGLTGEPTTGGYAPIAVERSDVGWPTLALDSGDYQVTSKKVTFQASGGTIGPVTSCVLATSSDDTGKIITYAPLSQSRTLNDGESLDITYRVKLQ